MKKLLALLLSAFLCVSLMACGGSEDENSIEGTWKLKSIILDGEEEMTAAQYYEQYMSDPDNASWSIEIKEDGTFTFIRADGDSYEEDGTWEETETDVYTLTLDDDPANFIMNSDGTLTADLGGLTATFEK